MRFGLEDLEDPPAKKIWSLLACFFLSSFPIITVWSACFFPNIAAFQAMLDFLEEDCSEGKLFAAYRAGSLLLKLPASTRFLGAHQGQVVSPAIFER